MNCTTLWTGELNNELNMLRGSVLLAGDSQWASH